METDDNFMYSFDAALKYMRSSGNRAELQSAYDNAGLSDFSAKQQRILSDLYKKRLRDFGLENLVENKKLT